MTTTTKSTRREKKQGGGVGGDGSSTSVTPTTSSSSSTETHQHKNPVHERGNLSYAEAHQEALRTHHQWVLDRLESGEMVSFSWKKMAMLMELIDHGRASLDPATFRWFDDLSDLQSELLQLLPYDEQAWRTRRHFVPRVSATDCNGRPPALGFYKLPISEFKKRTPPLVEEV